MENATESSIIDKEKTKSVAFPFTLDEVQVQSPPNLFHGILLQKENEGQWPQVWKNKTQILDQENLS